MQKISEKNVASLWKSGRLSRFQDDMGNDVEVVCPGRETTKPGCDFQDVVISINREKLVGDIELHLSSDLWQKHGHHTNPAYNGIILHVAMWRRGSLPVKLETGLAVPTIILSGYITERSLSKQRSGRQLHHICPASARKVPAKIKRILMQAGMQRFSIKSSNYAAAITALGAEQTLYKGVCRALGYSRNTAPFEALADRLPVDLVMNCKPGSLVSKQAMLIGTAGLLPSQGASLCAALSGEAVEGIEKEWANFIAKPSPLSPSDWSFSYLRPGNHPLNRLVYLGRLLQAYEITGLFGGFTDLIEKAPPGREAVCLEKGLFIDGGSHLIGVGRAMEIALNQVLPFLLACAVQHGDISLAARTINTYLNYRPLPDNELLRYMKGQLRLEESKDLNACVQQGLLHIYHSFCRAKDCSNCPLFTRRSQARG
jgi:hypothetical protein